MNTTTTPRPLPATQAEIASLAGCARQTVAKWQRGEDVHPAIDAAIRAAVREEIVKIEEGIEKKNPAGAPGFKDKFHND